MKLLLLQPKTKREDQSNLTIVKSPETEKLDPDLVEKSQVEISSEKIKNGSAIETTIGLSGHSTKANGLSA
jgi:hypothetical protein